MMLDGWGFGFRGGKVDSNDGLLRTFCHTFAAHLAFGVIDVGQIVFDRDGFERARLRALSAADARGFAVFHCNRTFFLIAARNVNAASFRPLVAYFDNASGTVLRTNAAADALLFVNSRQLGLRIDVDGVETASPLTVTATETSVGTVTFPDEKVVGKCTRKSGVVLHFRGCVFAISLATDHRNFWLHIPDFNAHQFGNFHIVLFSIAGTGATFHRAFRDNRFGQIATAGETAPATICPRKKLRDLVNARIFFYVKLFGNEK